MKSIPPEFVGGGWKYAMLAHRNSKGLHYDLLMSPPDEAIVYSWSTKTVPFRRTKTAAWRTRNRLREALDFKGEFITKLGYNRKKLLAKGKLEIESVDDNGFIFKTAEGKFRLENIKKRRYVLKGLSGKGGSE